MKKLFIGIFAIIILAFAGKFGLEYQYKKQLDADIQRWSPLLDTRYKDLFFDLKGNLNITNITIRNKTSNFEFSLEKLQAHSSDKSLFIKGFDSLEDGKFPESINLTFSQLSFDTKSTPKVDADRECRYIDEGIEIGNFTDSNVTTDIIVNIESKSETHFKAKFQTFVKGISESSAEFILDKSLLSAPLSAGPGKDLPIKNILITNTFNQSYADRALAYCAKKLELSTEAYLNDVIGSDKYYQALKLTPSKELKSAIKTHYSGKSTITVKAEPNATGRNINRLALYKPEQIIQALNLEIEEDGKKIPKLLGIPSPIQEQSLAGVESDPTQQNATPNKPNNTKPKKFYGRRIFKFQPIKVNEIKNYIGKTAKITRKKRLISGEILSVKAGAVKFDNKQFGGSTIMSLPLSEITKVEVKVFSNQ